MAIRATISVTYVAVAASARLLSSIIAVAKPYVTTSMRVASVAYVAPLLSVSFLALTSTIAYAVPSASAAAAGIVATVSSVLGLLDSFSVSDTSIVFDLSKVFVDTVGSTDAVTMDIAPALSDNVTADESLARVWDANLSLSDAATAADSALIVFVSGAAALNSKAFNTRSLN